MALSSQRFALGILCLFLLFLPERPAEAVVVQVDGKIVPSGDDGIQKALNRGENGCPTAGTCYTIETTPPNNAGVAGPQGAIDMVNEARTEPQVFAIPKTGGNFATVTTVFLWHGGAYYRNTFGWYNVGDDLTNFANLHPIITNSPTFFYQAGEGTPFSTTVDFNAQFTAGNYKGGFVGFYLITPEGSVGFNTDCRHDNGSAGNNTGHELHFGYYDYTGGLSVANATKCVGRTYYTERELNGDGNYVHYIIYQTKVLDSSARRRDDYYFSFEDTYRSTDVGTADDTVLVQGLVAPCTPSPEVCDGQDNNCDGVIDNNLTDTGGSCTLIPGNPVGVGECKAGTLQCVPTTPGNLTTDHLVCTGEVGPQPESCDAKDNDCNGGIDNPAGGAFVPPLANACGVVQGTCVSTTSCISGITTCVPQVGPKPEVCNGLDDNCNGLIDDGTSDVNVPCTNPAGAPTIGECKAGHTACLPATAGVPSSDQLTCVGYQGPTLEICDGKDNNCNGLIDESPTDLAATCTPSGAKGVCMQGHEVCVNGAKVCAGFTFGQPEVCNGKDDDCNGTIDDNPVDVGGLCGSDIGVCKPGHIVCKPTAGTDVHTDAPVCEGDVKPSIEVCDGLDNNCNGLVDENPDQLSGVGVDCSTRCGAGKTICKDGSIQCNGQTGGLAETCNGKDDDCNGVIDDNPSDIGGSCGTVVINPNIMQNAVCKPGALACVPQTAGDLTTDKIVCSGENLGTPEICNNIDDNCNGVVDENVPGEGEACAPLGLMLPLPESSPCKPGKTLCIAGTLTCTGAVAPTPEICDNVDNDCDGVIDDAAPCPEVGTKCLRGACRLACSSGEFPCPGGQICQEGFCVKPECDFTCGAGTSCDPVQHACVDVNGAIVDGGVLGEGGVAGDGGMLADGQSRVPSADGGLQSGADGGAHTGTEEGESRATLGLATGGGGCACTVGGSSKASTGWGAFGLAMAASLRMLRSRKAKRRLHEARALQLGRGEVQ